ncbi:DUF3500 domain-containing protein [Eudoraea adriatica]|uniref:DUF3500 domain-containing protein n=1 Tax=Eudoraea adriatica TaxID=446681 RepID=UPI00036FF331|nr:DUF3500 domain-containing protein [Eudoraea adriatica]
MKFKSIFLMLGCGLYMAIASSQELNTLAAEFLNTLDPELKSRTIFAMDSEERLNFHFVPIIRKGPTFHDFNDKQKNAAMALLRGSLSNEGFRKTKEIIALENVLLEIEGGKFKMPDGSPGRDALNYHFCVFNDPATQQFWGWRFEGHHISFNFVASEGKIVASTPSFLGSNPAIVREGSQKGKEVLKLETQLGFALVNSLSKEQLATALFSEEAPREIFTINKPVVTNLDPPGISYSDLTKDQKEALEKLLMVYLNNYESGFSQSLLDKIKTSGMNQLSFAWAGSLVPGKGHYYRIQSPVILIEYDNTQNNANHVHTAVRDLTNDFGRDLLKEHYNESHKH